MIDPLIQQLVAACLALLFLSGAIGKAWDLPGFRLVLGAYELLPAALLWPAAISIVLAEGATGILLLLPETRAAGAFGASVLLAVYALAIALNLARGRAGIECGCLGRRSAGLSAPLVVRNLCLLGLAMLLLPAPSGRPLVWLDAVVLAFGTVAAALLYAGMNQLIANRNAPFRRVGSP